MQFSLLLSFLLLATSTIFHTTTSIFCSVIRLTIRLIVLKPLNKLRQLDSTRALSSPRTLTQLSNELTYSQPIIQLVEEPKGTQSHLVCWLFPYTLFCIIFLFFSFFLFLLTFKIVTRAVDHRRMLCSIIKGWFFSLFFIFYFVDIVYSLLTLVIGCIFL